MLERQKNIFIHSHPHIKHLVQTTYIRELFIFKPELSPNQLIEILTTMTSEEHDQLTEHLIKMRFAQHEKNELARFEEEERLEKEYEAEQKRKKQLRNQKSQSE